MSKRDFFIQNRQAIADALPHGAVKIIADALKINRITVDRALNLGWKGEFVEQICHKCMLLIEVAETAPTLCTRYNAVALLDGMEKRQHAAV